MSKTLAEILGADTLCGTIEAIKPGVPRLLPDAFFSPSRTVEGDQCTYTRVNGGRQTARISAYGSPARRRGLKGIAEVPIKLLHSFEQITHKPSTLMNLRNYANESKQKLGQAEIARHTRDFAQLFIDLRTSSVHSALALGLIHFDGDGNLLPTSSGAVTSIDFGIPASNRSQLDVLGDGDILSASWATDGTDIVGDLEALKVASMKLTGYTLGHAYYGSSVLADLLSNTGVNAALQSHPAMAAAFMLGEIPQGFLGMQWHPMDGAFFNDADDASQSWWPADQVAFTPAVSTDWYELIQGTMAIPTSIGNIYSSGDDALGSIREAPGMFSYAKVTDNPVGIDQFAGDTFLPVIKVPNAVFIADVHF